MTGAEGTSRSDLHSVLRELDEIAAVTTDEAVGKKLMAIHDAVLAMAVPAEFPVATICGSMRFYDRMVKVAERLTAEGVVVLMPFVTVATDNQGDEFKAMLDRMHRQKIDAADHIVVVTDADSPYVGESTNREIQYAAETGKPITWALEGVV